MFQLSRPQGVELRVEFHSRGFPNYLENAHDGCFCSRRDIESTPDSRRPLHSGYNVCDVHIVSSGAPVTEQRRALSLPQHVAEDGHYAGLAIGALSWTEDVAEPANGMGDTR